MMISTNTSTKMTETETKKIVEIATIATEMIYVGKLKWTNTKIDIVIAKWIEVEIEETEMDLSIDLETEDGLEVEAEIDLIRIKVEKIFSKIASPKGSSMNLLPRPTKSEYYISCQLRGKIPKDAS